MAEVSFSAEYLTRTDAIAAVFQSVFSASEGSDEGASIGALAKSLMAQTSPDDLYVFTAWQDATCVGAIIFSRLSYASDDRTVFVLGPVAIATDRQGSGIGQSLIAYGLNMLRSDGVAVAVTYGDPGFYTRVGFIPITQDDLSAPFPLQHPEGWLAQSLDQAPLHPFQGSARCVRAFNDPTYW